MNIPLRIFFGLLILLGFSLNPVFGLTGVKEIKVPVGDAGLADIAIDLKTNQILVGDSFDILVVDPNTGIVGKKIPINGIIVELAVNPNSNVIYIITVVEGGRQNILHLYDYSTLKEITQIKFEGYAGSLIINENTNILYILAQEVTNKQSILVFDGNNKKFLNSITHSEFIQHIGIDSKRNLLYLADPTNINVYDLKKQKITQTIDGYFGDSFVIDSEKNTIYYTQSMPNREQPKEGLIQYLFSLELNSLKKNKAIQIPSDVHVSQVAFNPKTQILYYAEKWGNSPYFYAVQLGELKSTEKKESTDTVNWVWDNKEKIKFVQFAELKYKNSIDDIDISPNDNIYTFSYGEKVTKSSKSGFETITLSGMISDPRLGKYAVDRDDNIYFIDEMSGAVKIFDKYGKLIKSWETKSSKEEDTRSRTIVVDSQKNVVVAKSNTVGGDVFLKFSFDGKLIKSWNLVDSIGRKTSVDGITIDSSDNIYFSDSYGNVWKTTTDGKVLMRLHVDVTTTPNYRETGLSKEYVSFGDIAIDGQNNFYLGYQGSEIIKFSPSGEYLGRLSIPSTYPVFDVDSQGNIVLEQESKIIKRYFTVEKSLAQKDVDNKRKQLQINILKNVETQLRKNMDGFVKIQNNEIEKLSANRTKIEKKLSDLQTSMDREISKQLEARKKIFSSQTEEEKRRHMGEELGYSLNSAHYNIEAIKLERDELAPIISKISSVKFGIWAEYVSDNNKLQQIAVEYGFLDETKKLKSPNNRILSSEEILSTAKIFKEPILNQALAKKSVPVKKPTSIAMENQEIQLPKPVPETKKKVVEEWKPSPPPKSKEIIPTDPKVYGNDWTVDYTDYEKGTYEKIEYESWESQISKRDNLGNRILTYHIVITKYYDADFARSWFNQVKNKDNAKPLNKGIIQNTDECLIRAMDVVCTKGSYYAVFSDTEHDKPTDEIYPVANLVTKQFK